LIDYHVHTPLCYHARGSMEACVRHAVSTGLSEICFLDHLTVRPEKKPTSMTPEEVGLYFNAVKELKALYADRIAVKAGIEVDFNPLAPDAVEKILDTFDFDVVGSSVHFLNGLNIVSHGAAAANAKMDPDTLYTHYLDTLHQMCRAGGFDMICHLDLIKKFGKRPIRDFTVEFEAVLDLVSIKGLVVEVNTSGLDHPIGELYPSESLLRACREKGIPVTLSSDAHSPKAVGAHSREGLAAVRKAGYEHLTGFTRRIPYARPLPHEGELLQNGTDPPEKTHPDPGRNLPRA